MHAIREFPVSREIIGSMPVWVNQAADPLLPAVRVETADGFEWRFREESSRALAIAKVVRMASGLNGALVLTDSGLVTEAGVLLRAISDLSTEVIAVLEGDTRGEPTRAQRDFVRQFFDRDATGTLADGAPRRFVGRDELLKAHDRLAEKVGFAGQTASNLKRAINFGLDGYVHGSYASAMELYHGGRHEFMMSGHEGLDDLPIYRVSLALATHEALIVVGLMALALADMRLKGQIDVALDALARSGEQDL